MRRAKPDPRFAPTNVDGDMGVIVSLYGQLPRLRTKRASDMLTMYDIWEYVGLVRQIATRPAA